MSNTILREVVHDRDPKRFTKEVRRIARMQVNSLGNLPQLERRASDQRMDRRIPTEALTYYSRGLLYQDRGQKDKAAEMFTHAIAIFPEYAEAQESLQRVKPS